MPVDKIVVETNRYLVASLPALLTEFAPPTDDGVTDFIKKVFMGQTSGNHPFQIPAADNNGLTVYFNNRELLQRFTSMTTQVQEHFLKCIRETMRQYNPKVLETVIHLTVSWSTNGVKIIEIRMCDKEGNLSMHIN